MIVERNKIQLQQQLHPKNRQTAQGTPKIVAKIMAKTAKMAAKEQKVQTQIPLFATTCQFCQAVQLHQGQTLQVKKTPNLAIFKDFWQIFTN